MLRTALIALAILASLDHMMYAGKYTSVAMQASSSILHHLRVI
jgi:hypothetical protein